MTRLGNVTVQSGLALGREGERASRPIAPGPRRAVVLKTYVADTSGRRGFPVTSDSGFSVLCDVILYREQVLLHSVPVKQVRAGVGDADLWIPRGLTQTVDTEDQVGTLNTLTKRGTPTGAPLPPTFARMDGDHVLVDFMDNRRTQPIIIGAYHHPSSHRVVTEGNGPNLADLASTRGKPKKMERYTRFAGVEARISATGDVVLDATGANPSSVKDETPQSTGGEVVLALKKDRAITIESDGVKVLTVKRTDSGVDIRLASDTASQQYMRGNDFADAFYEWFDALGTLVDAINAAITSASGTTSGTVTIPVPALVAFDLACTVMREDAPQQYLSRAIRGE